MVKFKERKRYHVSFSLELSKVEVSVELLDKDKKQIMCLTGTQQNINVDIDKTKRYYLVVRFKSATGKYDLRWDYDGKNSSPVFIYADQALRAASVPRRVKIRG